MDEINKYIDDIFKNITKTKKSRRLKEQIKMAAKEKYNDLISEGISQDEAAKNVILQIGSLEDLKAEHPVKHRKLDIIAYILILPTMISLGYSIFVLLKMDTLKQLVMYEPIFLSFYILKPFNYFSLTFIILWFFNNSSLSVNKIKIRKEWVRITVLLTCICIIIFYFFNTVSLTYFHFIHIPDIFNSITRVISEISYVFILIAALLFVGIKTSQ